MLRLMKVKGQSMWPTMAGGDFVLVSRFFWRLKKGEIIVVNHPDYGQMIKRIATVDKQKGILLSGDNREHSLSTETMGWFARPQILGKVLKVINKTQS